jgi:hypothetical protein
MPANTSSIAAQVVLNPEGSQRAPWVTEQFKEAGFEVGPFVGTSFSISAPVRRFETFFKIRAEQKGPMPFSDTDLPLSALSPSLRKYVEHVLFTPPPDFGPTGHFS